MATHATTAGYRGTEMKRRPVWTWVGPIALAAVLTWLAVDLVGVVALVLWSLAGVMLAGIVGAVLAETERVGRPERTLLERIDSPGCVLLSQGASHRRRLWEWVDARRLWLLSGKADLAIAALVASSDLGTSVDVEDLEEVIELVAAIDGARAWRGTARVG